MTKGKVFLTDLVKMVNELDASRAGIAIQLDDGKIIQAVDVMKKKDGSLVIVAARPRSRSRSRSHIEAKQLTIQAPGNGAKEELDGNFEIQTYKNEPVYDK